MVSILYVDSDPAVLDRVKQELKGYRPYWRLHTANSASMAMSVMSAAPADVIVADMGMKGTDGAQLIAAVRESFPRTIRILLSSFGDTKKVMESVGDAHQYLTKPLDSEVLINAVENATALDTILENDRLRGAVTHLKNVPSLPVVYCDLMEEVNKVDPSIKRVAQIVGSDIGMTAKILQIANSAFFGFRKSVSSPVEAVRFLGLDTITSLALAVGVFAQFGKQVNTGYISEIWNHSTKVARMARDIASIERPTVAEDAFTAGLLHDIGEVVMAANAPRAYSETRDFGEFETLLRLNAEREKFGATHYEIGAYLLNLWGIPNRVVEAVAFHHTPSKAGHKGFNAVTAVHAADGLVHVPEFDEDYRLSELMDLDYFQRAGLRQNVDMWIDACVKAEPAMA
ncbi:MAG: HDOD domain-containing protein [Pyrinomonadaceae bacterium]|nr:HDOD domain-containing protein [Pyrinomonadaceae bacterium]